MAKKTSRKKKTAKTKESRTKSTTTSGKGEKAGKATSRSKGSASTRAGKPPKGRNKGRKPRRFDAKTLRAIRDELLRERDELSEQLREIEEAAFGSTQSEISGEVGYDEDYADAGSATFEREKDLSIQNNILDLLEKVQRALKKIEDKTYGICESCGNPIESARLKALPSVVLCLECKKREERR